MEPSELLRVFLFLSAVIIPITSAHNLTIGYNWLLIDCGSSNVTTMNHNITTWHTDQEFINTGKNFLLIPSQNFNTMNTLRFFPDGNRNCYTLPLSCVRCKYLFRAGFFYGNYDGLSKPPSFKLEIDGNLWANVTTSSSQEEPVYHEVIYTIRKEETLVCLVRNSDDDQVPFISSLEVKSLFQGMYRLMENDTALYLQNRIDYGANKTYETIDLYGECCNRIWKSKEMTEYLNIPADHFSGSFVLGENYPPRVVMASAIQAKQFSDSIYLSVNFSLEGTVKAYFVLYFMDPVPRFPENGTSKVEIYVDSKKFDAVDVPEWGAYPDVQNVVSLYPVRVSGSANVTIAPANGSTMGPLLNAMEVYHAIDASQGSKGGNLLGPSLAQWVTLLLLLYILV